MSGGRVRADGASGGRRPGWRHEPSPSRLAPDHPRWAEVLGAHDAALAAGRPTYVDPLSGYQVMTADTLSARGECCDTGCRHCPWAPAADVT